MSDRCQDKEEENPVSVLPTTIRMGPLQAMAFTADSVGVESFIEVEMTGAGFSWEGDKETLLPLNCEDCGEQTEFVINLLFTEEAARSLADMFRVGLAKIAASREAGNASNN